MSLASKLASVLAIAGMVSLLLSLALPWFQLNLDGDLGILGRYRIDTRFEISEYSSWAYVNGALSSNASNRYAGSPYGPVGDLMKTELIWLGASIASTAAFAGLLNRKTLRLVIGTLTLAFCIVALVYLPFVMPSAVNESQANMYGSSEVLTIHGFWGSEDVSIFRVTWGPSISWFLVLISTFLVLFAVVLGIISRSDSVDRD